MAGILEEKQVNDLFYAIRFGTAKDVNDILNKYKSEGKNITDILFSVHDPTAFQDEPLPVHAACTRNDEGEARVNLVKVLLDAIEPQSRVQEMFTTRAGSFKRTPLLHACGKFDDKLVQHIIDRTDDPIEAFKTEDMLGYNCLQNSWNNNYSKYDTALVLYHVAKKHNYDEELLSELDEGNKRMFFRDILPQWEDEQAAAAEQNGDEPHSATPQQQNNLSTTPQERKLSNPGGGGGGGNRKKSMEPIQDLPPSALGPEHFDYRNQVEYEARQKELQNHNEAYVAKHPEFQQLLHDLMQSMLFHRPEDPLKFINDHFKDHYTISQ